jgi:hypothetical protein
MSKKKLFYLPIGAMILVLAGFLSQSNAADVIIKVSPPPEITISSEPDVIEIPNTDVYYIPDVPEHIVFYEGNWYRLHENHWFMSTSYSGPWAYVESPPSVIVSLPSEYHGEHHVHWRDLKDKWREWRREHHEHEMHEH